MKRCAWFVRELCEATSEARCGVCGFRLRWVARGSVDKRVGRSFDFGSRTREPSLRMTANLLCEPCGAAFGGCLIGWWFACAAARFLS